MQIDFSRLNEPQQQAVKHIDGPLLVLAGAGTGKTTVITFRIVNMINKGVKPENILAVTFTNKAAREMRERLHALLPQLEPEQLAMSTFHSFCCRILRRQAKKIGRLNNFGIADEGDTKDIIREIMANYHLKTEIQTADYFISGISNAKNDLKEPEDLQNSPRSFLQVVGKVYGHYEDRLKQMNLLDFDDLLRLTVKLFEKNDDVLKEYQERFQYLLVDEYQDTNMCQARLLELLAGKRKNVCVVGDDDQSIYGWRGAEVDNILNFPNYYKGATVVKLEENYRSTNTILEAANFVIAHNHKRHGKALWSKQGKGDPVRLYRAQNADKEAEFIAETLREYKHGQRVSYQDMAILYRSNHLSRRLEHSLRKFNIPYRLVGSKGFYERREIKDAVAFLRIIANPYDDLAFRRIINVPPRGVGNKSLETLINTAEVEKCSLTAVLDSGDALDALPGKTASAVQRMSTAVKRARISFSAPGGLAQKIHDYLDDLGYISGLKLIYKNHEEALSRLANINEFLVAAQQFDHQTLQEFLEANALTDAQDKVDDKHDEDGHGVTLMTTHAAKGLEFPLVFIIGLEHGLFPHERSIQDGSLDEERRLFYVAVTRAKERLFLTRAIKRETFGKTQQTRPSQFLAELPEDLVEEVDPNRLFEAASQDDISDIFAKMRAQLGND